jgi:putative oxidoreductase
MDVVFLVGRILIVALPIMSGATFHFQQAAVDAARGSGAPAPEITVPLSGIVMVVGGISVVLGILGDVGALLVIAALLPITFFQHAFWTDEDPQAKQLNQVMFWKNLAMIGGLLTVFWIFNQTQGDAPLTITDPLFSSW